MEHRLLPRRDPAKSGNRVSLLCDYSGYFQAISVEDHVSFVKRL